MSALNSYGLIKLLAGVATVSPVPDIQVAGVCADSRKFAPGQVFVAVKGPSFDGHAYLDQVIDRGCRCLVVEKGRASVKDKGVAVVEVDDSRRALGLMARNLYGRPDEDMVTVAITGTNGKTTTSYFLESIFSRAGRPTGVVGTVSWRWPGVEEAARLTTPGPLEIYAMLARMRAAGVSHLVMEVSSHALDQERIAGLFFDAALFTNLSRDHLDYHRDMEEYYQAKKRLFLKFLKDDGIAVVFVGDHVDDAGRRMAGELGKRGIRTLTCGNRVGVDYYPAGMELSSNGSVLDLAGVGFNVKVSSRLCGDFNTANLLLAAAAAHGLGFSSEEIAAGIGEMTQVPGRLEKVENGHDHGFSVYVDYAHTPDALNRVLTSLSALSPRRLVTVFGCGGDRDRGKRARMGEEAARIADVVVVTSDNPRGESPAEIADQVEGGIRGLAATGPGRLARRKTAEMMRSGDRGYDVILSREDAIRTVIDTARSGDMIAICGKGHEDYQEKDGKRIWFDDRVVARTSLTERWAREKGAAGTGK